MNLVLASHDLCPYVQRAAIVLHEKRVPFERRSVDLAHKPDWFKAVSPLGKTPVLLVEGEAIFESAVICEYLDEVFAPRLHPADPLQRAHHRAWIEFASGLLNAIGAFYGAPDVRALDARREDLRSRFAQVEQVLDARGPYFAGSGFGIVDAAWAPVFRYFDVFGAFGIGGFIDGLPKVQAWLRALAQRESVRTAVRDNYAQLLGDFLRARGSEISRRIDAYAAEPMS
jgi:glutathione S-transferase